MQRRVLIGLLLGFCGVVMFGVTLPMTRLALDDLGPWFISFGRATIGGVLAVLLVLVMGRRVPLRGRTLRDLLVATVTLVFMFPLLMAVATQTVPASHGGVVRGLLPPPRPVRPEEARPVRPESDPAGEAGRRPGR